MFMEEEEKSLIGAASQASLENVQRYLSSGVNVNCQDKYGYTPLHWASRNGHVEVVNLLMKYDADPNISDKRGLTPLHVVPNEVIAECLISSGADINTLTNYGSTPLYEASETGHVKVVKLLLKYNADPNIVCELDLNTALHGACEYGHKSVVQCLVENGANVKTLDKYNQTPVDILKQPHEYIDEITERRKECLEWLKEMGYLEDASAVPIADLSTEISSSSPSVDKMDSYGLSLDVDPSLLSSQGSPILADIKVFIVDDDDKVSTPSFTFPEETKPVSAVYTISLSDTHVPLRTLRIRHCADPDNPEELEQLMFVKSSNDSSSKFEVVPGGIFKPGEQYGEITPPHMCSWTIVVRWIKKLFVQQARYVGTLLYNTVKQNPYLWLMQLIVAKHDPKSTLALNEYINNKCSHDVVKEPEFLFTFEDSDWPKLSLTMEKNKCEVLKCSNGWEIRLDIKEISKDTVDHFKRSTDVPGRCSLNIHTHMNVCHELALLPTVTLNGIICDKKVILINPPIDYVFEFEWDYSNVRPQLKINMGKVPTLEVVFDLMKYYSARWNEFARALRIPFNDRQIFYDERISADVRLEKVINQWIESQCSPVTWDYLIDVMKRMGLQDVIDVIEDCDAISGTTIPENELNTTMPEVKTKTETNCITIPNLDPSYSTSAMSTTKTEPRTNMPTEPVASIFKSKTEPCTSRPWPKPKTEPGTNRPNLPKIYPVTSTSKPKIEPGANWRNLPKINSAGTSSSKPKTEPRTNMPKPKTELRISRYKPKTTACSSPHYMPGHK